MCTYNRINEMRKKKGITWKFLNENIPGKVYSSRMTELKNGKTALSGEQLIVVAKILETSTDYLLGNTDDPSPAGQKESPAADSGSGAKYPPGYELLTPENRAKADSYLAFLLAEQQSGQT